MDYLEGRALDEILRDGRLQPQRALRLFVQMCSALEHAHKNGIIHRDLKPSNVVVVGEGDDEYVKVLDFGLAKLGEETTKLTTSGEIFGSPPYMSPEQCRGETCYMRSDIYSLGVLMYEVLVGKDPFYGCSYWNLLMKHMHTMAPPFAEMNAELNINSEFEKIVFKCLQKETSDRFQSMAELKEALLSMQRRTGTTKNDFIRNVDTVPLETTKEPVKSSNGFGAIAIGIIIVLLLVASAAGVYQLMRQAQNAASVPPAVSPRATRVAPQPATASVSPTVQQAKIPVEKLRPSRPAHKATQVIRSKQTQLVKPARTVSDAPVQSPTPAAKDPWARLRQRRSLN